ncbi:MAG: methyltransferase domain-containing protein [Vicinamibacterales bacterium]
MSDWDAAQYHRLSDPQRAWGLRVLERLQPGPGERILDLGCGTGRLTADIPRRAPGAVVTGVDRSRAMVKKAHEHFGAIAAFAQADGAALPFAVGFDAVFSTATFHWISDHHTLFAEIHRVLRSGGRLVSQCGGGPNLQRLYRRAGEMRASSRFGSYFVGWADPWNFESVDPTAERLQRIGFVDVRVSLEPAQTPFPSLDAYEEFVTTVCLRQHLDRLPEDLRQPFVHEIAAPAANDDPPLTLDYWRLNIDARKP